MPIQGFTRLRKLQLGGQTSLSSNSPATRIMPWRGPIIIEPARELPDVDTGSIDPYLPFFNGPQDVTDSITGKLAFDDLPYVYAGGLLGGVTPTGATAKTWVFQAASLSADAYGYLGAQWGDDTGGVVAGGGIFDSFEIGFGEDLSAFDISGDMVFANGRFTTTPFTGGLTLDDTPNWLYGADTEVFIDTVAASIGTTKLTDDVHSATFAVNGNNDRKRFANGSNTRFQLAGYGRGPREGTVTIVRAETASALAEWATLDDEPVPVRYIELRTTSPEIITGSTPYSNSIRVPAQLMTVTPGEIGGNATLEFTYGVKYDSTLGYAYRAVVVNTLSAL